MFYFLFSVLFFFFSFSQTTYRLQEHLKNWQIMLQIQSLFLILFVIFHLHYNRLIIIYSTTCVFALFRRHFFFFRWVTVYMLQNTVLPFRKRVRTRFSTFAGGQVGFAPSFAQNFLQKSFKFHTHTLNALTFGFLLLQPLICWVFGPDSLRYFFNLSFRKRTTITSKVSRAAILNSRLRRGRQQSGSLS